MSCGTLLETSRCGEGTSAHFEWRLERWGWSTGMYRNKWSPWFHFAGWKWRLILDGRESGEIRVRVHFFDYQEPEERVRCWLGVRTADGGEAEVGSATVDARNPVGPTWTLSNLEIRGELPAPSGTLAILFKLWTEPESGDVQTAGGGTGTNIEFCREGRESHSS